MECIRHTLKEEIFMKRVVIKEPKRVIVDPGIFLGDEYPFGRAQEAFDASFDTDRVVKVVFRIM
jgi:hypothetical protein